MHKLPFNKNVSFIGFEMRVVFSFCSVLKWMIWWNHRKRSRML